MEDISVKEVRSRFAEYCNNLLTYNRELDKEFVLEGIIKDDIKISNKFMYFTITDNERASIKVIVNKDSIENLPVLSAGNKVRITGRLSLYKDGFVRGFELIQFNAKAIERLSGMSREYSSALLYVSTCKKVKKTIDYSKKSYMTVAVITSRDGEGLHDVQYALKRCDYFKLKHVPTNMFEPEQIAANIADAHEDVILIVRGGTTNVDIFNDVKILRAVVNSNSYTVCGIGHAQQEPLINKIVDVEQSTPTSAGQYLKSSYGSFVKELELRRRELKFKSRQKSKNWLIAGLIIAIILIIIKYSYL